MAIDIGSWNTEQRLTLLTDKERGTPGHILDGIEALNRGVLVLPEAFQEAPAEGVNERLAAMGYEWFDVRNDDSGREEEYADAMPYTRILSRLAIKASSEERFGGLRNTPIIEVEDPATSKRVRVIGIYLRDDSESMRLAQARDIADYLERTPDMPTVALGDWNAMHLRGRARIIGSRVMRIAAKQIPQSHIRYVAERFTDMASGEVLAEFERRTGMRDLDSHYQPTTTPKMRGIMEKFPSVRMAQIDHIYATPDVDSQGVRVHSDRGSDHRAITTTVFL